MKKSLVLILSAVFLLLSFTSCGLTVTTIDNSTENTTESTTTTSTPNLSAKMQELKNILTLLGKIPNFIVQPSA